MPRARLIGDIEAANEARAAGGAEPVRFGIGLHVGTVTFGNVGTEDRLDFTVIGSAVNRASRLEGLTKALGVPGLRLGRLQRGLRAADEIARHPPPARRAEAGRDFYAAGLRLGQTSAFQPSIQASASSSGSGCAEASTSSRSPMRVGAAEREDLVELLAAAAERVLVGHVAQRNDAVAMARQVGPLALQRSRPAAGCWSGCRPSRAWRRPPAARRVPRKSAAPAALSLTSTAWPALFEHRLAARRPPSGRCPIRCRPGSGCWPSPSDIRDARAALRRDRLARRQLA